MQLIISMIIAHFFRIDNGKQKKKIGLTYLRKNHITFLTMVLSISLDTFYLYVSSFIIQD